jgi:thioredoxin 1
LHKFTRTRSRQRHRATPTFERCHTSSPTANCPGPLAARSVKSRGAAAPFSRGTGPAFFSYRDGPAFIAGHAPAGCGFAPICPEHSSLHARSKKRNGTHLSFAQSSGAAIAHGGDEKNATPGDDARIGFKAYLGDSHGPDHRNDGRGCSHGVLLELAGRLHRDFAYSNLELLWVMENSVTIDLNEANFEREVTQSDKPVVVDFWAEWCGPCKMIAPLLDEIAKERSGSVKIAKVNVDQNQSLSNKYNIRAIPSLLFFKNGQLRDQITGMTNKKDLLGRIEALA